MLTNKKLNHALLISMLTVFIIALCPYKAQATDATHISYDSAVSFLNSDESYPQAKTLIEAASNKPTSTFTIHDPIKVYFIYPAQQWDSLKSSTILSEYIWVAPVTMQDLPHGALELWNHNGVVEFGSYFIDSDLVRYMPRNMAYNNMLLIDLRSRAVYTMNEQFITALNPSAKSILPQRSNLDEGLVEINDSTSRDDTSQVHDEYSSYANGASRTIPTSNSKAEHQHTQGFSMSLAGGVVAATIVVVAIPIVFATGRNQRLE
ncbi:hypothetical protein [Bifidobacterium jacchi]|uniref:Uncharacterized protein n=1 Tax=Bifidobacterium jacchi TaxID=2490545 RepID=A0A5N5REQ5_9BIFI|nr:hypothetical protein [Bifidobacterium jacchi]KAB5605390.1 hypothetical protein EHS19_09325 [Bifidobacterium jacchi]